MASGAAQQCRPSPPGPCILTPLSALLLPLPLPLIHAAPVVPPVPLSMAAPAVDTSNYAAMGLPNLSAAAAAAAAPALLAGLGGPTATALQLRLASAAGGVPPGAGLKEEPADKSETRRQRRCAGRALL